jgi:hypothetical protein
LKTPTASIRYGSSENPPDVDHDTVPAGADERFGQLDRGPARTAAFAC